MSASLVGSEMCIRDRLFVNMGGSTFESACHPEAVRCRKAGPCGVLEAVSYTHLTLPTICSV
eukprot:2804456-Alexandrium_andersonii.AAC.1